MITYKENDVYLDNKKVGTIESVKGGFIYFPLRRKIGGEIYSTIAAVKYSLSEY